MVNAKTFVGEGDKREENCNEVMGGRKNNFVNCLILEYQFFYVKRSQKTE